MFGSISNKRPREEHDHTLLNLDGDSIREQKRSRTLPLRTSPNNSQDYQHQYPLPILTPADSTDDEDENKATRDLNAIRNAPFQQGLRPPPLNTDTDNAMDLDTCEGNTYLNQSDYNYHQSPRLGANNARSIQPSPIPHGLVNRSLSIKEGYSESPGFACSAVNTNTPAEVVLGSEPMPLGVECHPLPSPTKDEDLRFSGEAIGNGFTWTQSQKQTRNDKAAKGKMVLSMGFRADCDKCRRRVPGHYSHIISS